MFSLFRVNFHNQYYAAFNDTQLLNQTKKLWLQGLKAFSAEQILKGAQRVIAQNDYLPTLHAMIQCCYGDPREVGLPEPHAAYREACQAPSPKANYHWSHPAVYFAGRDADWYFLANNTERMALPVFKQCYQQWCERVLAGKALPEIRPVAIEDKTNHSVDKEKSREQLQKLKASLS